jgi:S-DNA-T family DNA segregation ATPase FtsK/SpoIIIE
MREDFDRAPGAAVRIHVVASANDWNRFRTDLRALFGTKLELRLGDPFGSETDRKKAAAVPADRPGRGLSGDGTRFRTACPASTAGRAPTT